MFAHTELCFGVKNEHRARHKAQTHARRSGNVREDSSKALKISAAVRSTQILQIHHKESWPESQFLFDFNKKKGQKHGRHKEDGGKLSLPFCRLRLKKSHYSLSAVSLVRAERKRRLLLHQSAE